MVSRKAVGVAPLVVGFASARTTVGRLFEALQNGGWSASSLAALAGAVGSLAAIAVGAGILLEWRSFEATDDSETSRPLLLGIAVVAFAFGALAAVL